MTSLFYFCKQYIIASVFKEIEPMLHLISPAKSLDFEKNVPFNDYSIPEFKSESEKLIKKLSSLSKKKIKSMMSLSDNLTELNAERYQNWQGVEQISDQARQAIFAFTGDVYKGLNAYELNQKQLEYTQNHLIILSGLYGVLRPLDVIEPHRLEMGTALPIRRKKNLYEFWGDRLTEKLNEKLEDGNHEVLINLASNEYFKSINKKKIKAGIISPEFKDAKNGNYKIISFFAKKARGLMSRYIIENEIENVEDLKGFDYEGYRFNADLSTENKPVFTREENQK